jgi:hypothetical protein
MNQGLVYETNMQNMPQGVNPEPWTANPYQQLPMRIHAFSDSGMAQIPQNAGQTPVIYNQMPAQIPQNVYYGQYGYNPASYPAPAEYNNVSAAEGSYPVQNGQTERTGGSYNSGNQNYNTTNIYNTVPADNNSLPQAYPQQYYVDGYGNPQANSASPYAYDNSYNGMAEEDINTDTSQGIIAGLNELQMQEKELERNGQKTKVVALTNEYIMSLENYLNNPNTDIRLMAAKEILTRLDEDRSRYDDAALNALLNKMLQDPSKLVRIAAMSALSSELACGNDYTVQLLTNIQNNPDADPEDVLEASQILLKRASSTEIRYVPVYNQQQRQE